MNKEDTEKMIILIQDIIEGLEDLEKKTNQRLDKIEGLVKPDSED